MSGKGVHPNNIREALAREHGFTLAAKFRPDAFKRRAIESGADAALVAEWTADARKDRDAARRQVAAVRETPSRHDIAAVLARLSTTAAKLTIAAIAARRKLYADLGLRIVVTPGASTLKALVGGAGANGRVEGPIGPEARPTTITAVLELVA